MDEPSWLEKRAGQEADRQEAGRQEADRKEIWLKAILESAAEISQLGRAVRAHSNPALGVADLYQESDWTPQEPRGLDSRGRDPQELELRESHRQRLEAFRRAVANLLTLVNNYLDLSSIETGRFELEKIDFDLKAVLEHTLKKMGAAADAKQLIWKLTMVPGIPRPLAGDPARLGQILANLLNNAVQFADSGDIRITAEADQADPCRVHFSLTFCGTAMPDEEREGIGLCRTLLRQMGGELRLHCQPGQLCAFTFDVQFAPAARTQASPAAKPDSVRILIAEDSEDSRFLLQEFLKRGPYEVTFAENGKIAVEAALSQPFDLILMDIQMPVMDGLTATRLIREAELRESRTPIPLLALTAHTRKADIDLSLAAGCNAHISKPVSKSCLLSNIEKHLARRGETEEPAPGARAPADLEQAARRYILARRHDLPRMGRMIEAGEFQQLRELACDLKGTGASYGYPDLTRLGGLMEISAKEENTADLTRQLLELSRFVQQGSAAAEVLVPR